MDPEACYAQMLDEGLTDSERDPFALDLLVWLAKGGFSPGDSGAAVVTERCERIIRNRLDELAAFEDYDDQRGAL